MKYEGNLQRYLPQDQDPGSLSAPVENLINSRFPATYVVIVSVVNFYKTGIVMLLLLCSLQTAWGSLWPTRMAGFRGVWELG